MEENLVKVKKKPKTGPLKSSPGFLKCMRSVYLYFKEEKEKGALNIPINSFIERTAVACGVGRKTLYNYAKKGLFEDQPTILQQKKKRKRSRRRLGSSNGLEETRKLKTSQDEVQEPSSSKKKMGRSVQIQTDAPPSYVAVQAVSSTIVSTSTDSGMAVFVSADDNGRLKRDGTGQGAWPAGNGAGRVAVFVDNEDNIRLKREEAAGNVQGAWPEGSGAGRVVFVGNEDNGRLKKDGCVQGAWPEGNGGGRVVFVANDDNGRLKRGDGNVQGAWPEGNGAGRVVFVGNEDNIRLKREETVEVQGPWAGGNAARRDIDYFTKTNIWQSVYNINAAEPTTSELTPTRMGNCQPTSSDLTDL